MSLLCSYNEGTKLLNLKTVSHAKETTNRSSLAVISTHPQASAGIRTAANSDKY
jgi:hypothetical protein